MTVQEEIQEQVSALRQLRRREDISHRVYCKSVVGLCVNYTRAGDLQSAIDLLKGLPKAYFEDFQLEDMASDPAYCAIVTEVAEAVREHLQSEPQINMAGGDA